ncbi:MAG: outer membrane beta-barrel protein [Bacteroidota bacterium]|nr:outer membrane beta-barrel protein [Bacteroidota bacterium]
MKKFLSLVAMALLFTTVTVAQEFEQDDNIVSLGIGLGGDFGSFDTTKSSPGLSLQYEKGIWNIGEQDVIGLGGYLGYKSYTYKTDDADYKWTYTIIGVRGAYHVNSLEVENLDAYGGLMLSYNILSFDGEGSYGSAMGLTAFIGGRWYFTDQWAAMAEIGYGVSYLTVGVSYKL